MDIGILLTIIVSGCSGYFKNDYKDNTPTSGKLKVYYDESLKEHVTNQAFTFQSQYSGATIELVESTETEAIQALYKDSCETIVISRLLNEKEKKAFESKGFFPKYSEVAKSGLALITNTGTTVSSLMRSEVVKLLSDTFSITDPTGNIYSLKVLFDKSNSSVLHYVIDSIIRASPFLRFAIRLTQAFQP